MKTFRKLTIVVCLILGISGCARAEISRLLKAHFTAVGGLERLSEIQTLRRLADVQLAGAFGEMIGTAEEAAVIGKKSYMKTGFSGFEEVTVWNGKAGWKTNMTDGTLPLSGDELEFAKSAAFINPLQTIYEEHGSSAFQLGEDVTFNHMECAVLKVFGTQVLYYIDKTSHLIAGMTMPFTPSDANETTLRIYYDDYAEHAGVMFPKGMKILLGDGTAPSDYTYTCTYTKTEVDAALDETIFEKP